MHLIPRPLPHQKKCIIFVFHFSWVLQPYQEELKKKNAHEKFGGGGGGKYGPLWRLKPSEFIGSP